MTNEQKLQIEDMRKQSCGYSVIARTLNLSVSAVKGYCQRNHLDGFRAETPAAVVVQEPSADNDGDFCKQCGKMLVQKSHTKTALFCCGSCRQKWWNSHLDQVNRKAVYQFICICCGKEFTAYGNKHRKYCSHECYINARFRGGICNAGE